MPADPTTRINRVPLGLLDFLQNNSQGNNPSEFSSIVNPTLDLFSFLAAERYEVLTTDETTAGNANLSVNVPTGELWLVRNLYGQFDPANANNWASLELRLSSLAAGGNIGSGVLTLQQRRTPQDLAANEVDIITYESTQGVLALATATNIALVSRRVVGAGNNVFRLGVGFYRYST